jgi:hypothetical protein
MQEARRGTIVTAEAARAQQFGPRFRVVDCQALDSVHRGQAVEVTYRWAGGAQVEIISFQLKQPGE